MSSARRSLVRVQVSNESAIAAAFLFPCISNRDEYMVVYVCMYEDVK